MQLQIVSIVSQNAYCNHRLARGLQPEVLLSCTCPHTINYSIRDVNQVVLRSVTLTNAADYILTLLPVAGSQHHTAEAR